MRLEVATSWLLFEQSTHGRGAYRPLRLAVGASPVSMAGMLARSAGGEMLDILFRAQPELTLVALAARLRQLDCFVLSVMRRAVELPGTTSLSNTGMWLGQLGNLQVSFLFAGLLSHLGMRGTCALLGYVRIF